MNKIKADTWFLFACLAYLLTPLSFYIGFFGLDVLGFLSPLSGGGFGEITTLPVYLIAGTLFLVGMYKFAFSVDDVKKSLLRRIFSAEIILIVSFIQLTISAFIWSVGGHNSPILSWDLIDAFFSTGPALFVLLVGFILYIKERVVRRVRA